MSYDPNDPRAQLASASSAAPRATAADVAAAAEYFEFSSLEPDEVTALGTRSWCVRSQTAAVVYSMAVAGDRLSRPDQPDEYVAVLVSTPAAPAAYIEVVANGQQAAISDDSVVVVPPGSSELLVTSPGVVVRIFSNQVSDVVASARNGEAHADPHPHAAPFAPWPAAPDGDRLRVYRLADAPDDPNRFGNIYRCRTIMVNVLPPDPGPRNPSKLSPHHHDDFEQLSLQIDGDYVHHIRTPWTTNLTNWRDDEHHQCTSPALIVIPPPAVHTSQGVGNHRHQLIDIFCPPRLDFSAKPGWVLNHADYPDLPAVE
jgi:hypothetical protein